MSECVLCDIVAGSDAAARVRDDGATLAFIPLPPATEGHVLLVPKRHARNLFDISHGDLAAVAAAAKELALWQRERLGCIGVSMFLTNEADGFQSVFHYYVHVVRRTYVWCEASPDPRRLRRGDVVVIQGPAGTGHLVMKRLVALEGDRCDEWECGDGMVPRQHGLVLSDNRARRGDSRDHGPIPLGRVVARVLRGP